MDTTTFGGITAGIFYKNYKVSFYKINRKDYPTNIQKRGDILVWDCVMLSIYTAKHNEYCIRVKMKRVIDDMEFVIGSHYDIHYASMFYTLRLEKDDI